MRSARKVYVAASSNQLERAKQTMAVLEERGYTVTHDWVTEVEVVGEANPVGASMTARANWAKADLSGVAAADVMLLLMPAEGGFGAAVELGYALALGIPVVASGCTERTIFTALARCFDRDDLALEAAFPDRTTR
jgi:nucleoside 2-deoxyribosyltransferase